MDPCKSPTLIWNFEEREYLHSNGKTMNSHTLMYDVNKIVWDEELNHFVNKIGVSGCVENLLSSEKLHL